MEQVTPAQNAHDDEITNPSETTTEHSPSPTTEPPEGHFAPGAEHGPTSQYGQQYGPEFGSPPAWGPPPGYSPPPPSGSGRWAAPQAQDEQPSSTKGRLSGFARNALVAWIVAGVLAATVAGLSIALARQSSARAPASSSGRPGFFGGGFAGGGSGAGAGTFGGAGVFGTVASVGTNSFTVSTRAGQTVTVDEQSSTTYYNGTSSASSSAVVKGANVAVIGSRSGNTVTATRVNILPAGGFGPATGFGGSPSG